MAKVAKETFWNIEREKRGWSLKYIAKKTGIPQSTLGSWFTGIKSPRNDHHIQQLCNLFEIPFDKGYNEFYHAERSWDSSRKTLHYYDTYWNKLREDNNLSLEDISEMLGIGKSSISNHFSGRNIPRLDAITKYCKLFELSVEEGKARFKEAHEQFLAAQSGESCEKPLEDDTEVTEKASVEGSIDYTFWPSLFANSKFSVKDVAKFLNVDESKVQKYFSGEVTPNFNQIRMLCGLYGGVDMKTASTAFDMLHEHFLIEDSESSDKPVELPEIDKNIIDVVDVVLKSFFNEASYEEFIELQNYLRNKDAKALKMVYSVVDYDTYTALEAIVGR